ncbi:MAG: hypothetical protein HN736_04750 [Anaerolineae bacterium]|jgi:hypothetical protein|nr:hypothetical protein [Anaerolineae bacterium]MBT3712816.1 hypothetical protein [Anaerolineae bacterium]MBT4310730.1 hypothetical protein [Anaerolineae bacterium]MBT4841733.1 hypothetical protein [Anaerolineae bacterium]MBT6063121.1 hypothetical protein [Anaerolineae bacterium]
MKQRLFAFFIVFVLVFSLTTSVFAQSYSLELTQETVHVYWNTDGTMSLEYSLLFKNNPDALAIEFVDVVLPDNNYIISEVSAEIDGHALSVEEKYQGKGPGVAVDLGEYPILAGESGLVQISIGLIENVLNPDADANYVSAIFNTTWYGSQYITGDTDLTVIFHLPSGIPAKEIRTHAPSDDWSGNSEPESAIDEAGRLTYTWHDEKANGFTQYAFGVSFPNSYVPASAIVEPASAKVTAFSLSPIIYIPVLVFFVIIGSAWLIQRRTSTNPDES